MLSNVSMFGDCLYALKPHFCVTHLKSINKKINILAGLHCSCFEFLSPEKAMNHSKYIYEREEDVHGLVKNEILIQGD